MDKKQLLKHGITVASTSIEEWTSKISILNDTLLDAKTGLPRMLPSMVYKAVPRDLMRCWCHINKLYGLPTTELIQWLAQQIAPYDKSEVLEIGAGRSNIGASLGIRQTDRYMCLEEEAEAYYATLQVLPPYPPEGVERFDALEAVDKYKPKVVIASWVTQWVDPEDENSQRGSIFGVKKREMLSRPSVKLYIQISNLNVHGHEDVTRLARIHRPPWLASKGDPKKDVILTWNA